MDIKQMESNIANYVPDERALALVARIEQWRNRIAHVEPIVMAYKRWVLEELKLPVDMEMMREDYGDPSELLAKHAPNGYLVSPEKNHYLNEANQEKYFAAVQVAKLASGLETEQVDFCPLLEASIRLSQAQEELIAHMEPVTGISLNETRIANYAKVERFATLYEATIKFQLARNAKRQVEQDAGHENSPSIH
jgi:hypothetical protein